MVVSVFPWSTYVAVATLVHPLLAGGGVKDAGASLTMVVVLVEFVTVLMTVATVKAVKVDLTLSLYHSDVFAWPKTVQEPHGFLLDVGLAAAAVPEKSQALKICRVEKCIFCGRSWVLQAVGLFCKVLGHRRPISQACC